MIAEQRKPARVYADSSVYGGVFDAEFSRFSRAFFDGVLAGEFVLVTSRLVEEELSRAPQRVRDIFNEMLPLAELARATEQALALHTAYIAAGIVTAKSAADALHVAIATVRSCGVLVSWNCRHIVNFQKIPMYNAVNKLNGYAEIAIHTPIEVLGNED